ncbi:MAG: S-methyl-5-thioribose-1-phosphate isomerase [Thermoprotei archaeon ex4572_64]|nr:MAG: S-methyl-5-thioribose-1-phosphate isomerase [Thermoprotei archaeon ex4572_64]
MITIDELKRRYTPKVKPIIWDSDRKTIILLDQSKLPFETNYIELNNLEGIIDAIKKMKVRGAPAIGITAAYGIIVGLLERRPSLQNVSEVLEIISEKLLSTRPTAINLKWAIDRMISKSLKIYKEVKSFDELIENLELEANNIFDEEFEAELRMGLYGLEKLHDNDVVLTQCNAGGLATGTGLGTALAPIKIAHALGLKVSVIVPETRPWLQGARLTIYELVEEGVDATLITDTAVGYVMFRGMISSVMVGADRILSDGHVFNKIGTFKEAVIAHELGIPFYVLAPKSTFDFEKKVHEVVIEERDPDEVKTVMGKLITLQNVKAYNPVFDITPPKYITAIITEKGIIYPPFNKNIRKVLG